MTSPSNTAWAREEAAKLANNFYRTTTFKECIEAVEAALIAAERKAKEECARIAEQERDRCHMLENNPDMPPDTQARYAARYVSSADIAAAIRSTIKEAS